MHGLLIILSHTEKPDPRNEQVFKQDSDNYFFTFNNQETVNNKT